MAKKQLLYTFISIQIWNTRHFLHKPLTHTGAKEIFCDLQLHKGQSGLKALLHGAVVFLQQAHMFCPIFLSTIPPYIRPVISWVVTVRAQSANTVTSAAEGEQWREKEKGSGRGREENPALLFTARAARSERVVWEGGGERVRKWEVGLMQAGVITYWDSGAAFKVCYIRLSPGLAKLS